MSRELQICIICLRTDKRLKEIEKTLSNFHDELCNYSLNAVISQYCSECEYLLKKLYNFKNKCLKAFNSLQKWMSTSPKDRKPTHLIYTFLPPSSLKVFIPKEEINISFEYDNSQGDVKFDTKYISTNQQHLEGKVVITDNVTNTQELEDPISIKTEAEDYRFTECKIEAQNDIENTLFFNESDEIFEDKTRNTEHIDTYDVPNNDILSEDETVSSHHSDSDLNEFYTTYIDRESLKPIKSKDSSKKDQILYTKLRRIDQDLKDIYEKYEVILPNNKKRKIKVREKEKRRLLTGIEYKIKYVSKCKDGLKESTEAVLKQLKCGKLPFRNKLKNELLALFESHGEIKTQDGYLIDKGFIIHCLDQKLSADYWSLLSKNIHLKTKLGPKAIKLLYAIQNTYKEDAGFESVFHIEYLNTEERAKREFEERKTYECYTTANFKCQLCFLWYNYKQSLKEHMRYHDENHGTFTCSICKLRQKSKSDLTVHIKRAHEVVYKCKLCPMVIYYKTHMKNHFNQHNGEVFQCQICNKTFMSTTALKTHNSYQHVRKLAVAGETNRDNHITLETIPLNKEADTEMLSCDKCELTFLNIEEKRKHKRKMHYNIKPKVKNEKKEKKVIKAEAPREKLPAFAVTCRVCNVQGHIHWLREHFKSAHPDVNMDELYADVKPHLCDTCGKRFGTIHQLRYHSNRHTGALPYRCTVCPKSFHSPSAMRAHRLFHFPPSHVCSLCGKVFRSASNLSIHMRYHIRDRRYICHICTKGFIHASALKEHVKAVHYKEKRVRKRTATTDGEKKKRTKLSVSYAFESGGNSLGNA